jgi:hypothetical protein
MLIHVGFGADKVAMGQRFSSVNIIPPILHTHSFIYHQSHITLANDIVIKQHADKKSIDSEGLWVGLVPSSKRSDGKRRRHKFVLWDGFLRRGVWVTNSTFDSTGQRYAQVWKIIA